MTRISENSTNAEPSTTELDRLFQQVSKIKDQEEVEDLILQEAIKQASDSPHRAA